MKTDNQSMGFGQQTLGQIAALFPRARMILDQYDLDYCCNGEQKLADALAEQHLSTDRIEQQLSALQLETPGAMAATTTELSDHIVEYYHARHRRDLPELIKLAGKVESVHQFDANAPVGLADALEDLGAYLCRHMAAEEQTLFPAMCRSDQATVKEMLSALRPSRAMYPAHIQQLEEITGHFELPPTACHSWQSLYFSAARFVDELRYHVHLENNVLFPRFDER